MTRIVRDASGISLLIAILLGVLPTVAAAQDAPVVLSARPMPHVRPGQTIWVTMSDGRELRGRVVSVSVSTLEMTGPGGGLTVTISDVGTIEIRDSLKNGARYGAIVGGASLGVFVGLLSEALKCERDCGANYSATRQTIAGVSWGIGVGAGAGGLVGLLVDHLVKGRQVVYAAAPPTSVSWTILPVIAEKGLSGHATVRW